MNIDKAKEVAAKCNNDACDQALLANTAQRKGQKITKYEKRIDRLNLKALAAMHKHLDIDDQRVATRSIVHLKDKIAAY